MARQMKKTALLLALLCAVVALVSAQQPLPSDSNNTNVNPGTPPANGHVPTPVTPVTPATPVTPGTTPTITPPAQPAQPTPRTPSGGGDDSAAGPVVPTPTPPTKKPAAVAPVAAPVAPAVTPAGPATPAPPPVVLDRTVKSEYGTRSPLANDTTNAMTSAEGNGSRVGSWLVPAVIGAVIVAALVFMTFFMHNRREGDDDSNNTPRRSDNFFEHPKTGTNAAGNVAGIADQPNDKAIRRQSSARTHAVGGGPHSPRGNRAVSSPSSEQFNRKMSAAGFGTYKDKAAEGTSVGL